MIKRNDPEVRNALISFVADFIDSRLHVFED